jgi:hypothetical protein
MVLESNVHGVGEQRLWCWRAMVMVLYKLQTADKQKADRRQKTADSKYELGQQTSVHLHVRTFPSLDILV